MTKEKLSRFRVNFTIAGIAMMIILLVVTSCTKNSACYDEALFQSYKDRACAMDCPGVTGCDGKQYCNECVANQQGIRVQ